MSIVGDKTVFAIEWEIFPDIIDMNFRYWANSIPIGIWEDCPLIEPVISYTEDFLKYPKIRPLIDFSSLSKDDIYRCFYECYINKKFPSEYHGIHKPCLDKLLERSDIEKQMTPMEREIKFKYSFFIEDIENYVQNRAMQTDDIVLGSWMLYNFDIESLGFDCFMNHMFIYLVRDIAKEQERLVWQYHDVSFNEELTRIKEKMNPNYLTHVYEAVLPIGYFNRIASEFLQKVKEELEKIHQGLLVPMIDETNWQR